MNHRIEIEAVETSMGTYNGLAKIDSASAVGVGEFRWWWDALEAGMEEAEAVVAEERLEETAQ